MVIFNFNKHLIWSKLYGSIEIKQIADVVASYGTGEQMFITTNKIKGFCFPYAYSALRSWKGPNQLFLHSC